MAQQGWHYAIVRGRWAMAFDGEVSFGELLRRYRLQAALTQEELAERARLSAHAISQLERGARRAARKDTVDLLAGALALTETERAAFEAAARQHRMQSGPPASAPALSAADAKIAFKETLREPAAM